MKNLHSTRWLTLVSTVLVLTLIVGSTFVVGAEQRNSISAVGVSRTGHGLGVSISTPVYDIGEVRWTANGKRTEVEERRHYEESNYFGLQGILYPDFLSLQGLGMQLRAGAGLRGFGSSNFEEKWSADGYSMELNRKVGVYLLGSVQAATTLNLARGIEAFAITESETPEPSPFWSLLDPFYIVVTFQAGGGWENELPKYPIVKARGTVSLEYRF